MAGSHSVKTALVVMACVAVSFSSLQLGSDGSDDCRGIDPGNFRSILETTGISDDLLPVLNNQHCYCMEPDPSDPCPILCYPCDTNPDRCEIYGTCCSSRTLGGVTATAIRQHTSNADATSTQPEIKCYDEQYLIVKSCPAGYHDNLTIELCEEDTPKSETPKAPLLFVTDQTNNASYVNKYCAKCNGAKEIKAWSLEVVCNTYFYVRKALNESDLLRLSLKPGSKCQIFQRPIGLEPFPCDKRFYEQNADTLQRRHVIFECNDNTAKDSQLYKACGSSFNDKLAVVAGNTSFSNIFCLLCNKEALCSPKKKCADDSHVFITDGGITHDGGMWGSHADDFSPTNGLSSHNPTGCSGDDNFLKLNKVPPFQFMFGLGDASFPEGPVSRVVPGCKANQWMDPKGHCRQMLCTDGKVLWDNQCTTAMIDISSLPYRIGLLLTYPGHHNASHDITQAEKRSLGEDKTLVKKIQQYLLPLSGWLLVCVDKIDFGSIDVSEHGNHEMEYLTVPKHFLVRIFLVANRERVSYRDNIESQLLGLFHNASFDVNFGNYDIVYQSTLHYHSFVPDKFYCPSQMTCISDKRTTYQWNEIEDRYEYLSKYEYSLVQMNKHIPVFPYLMCPYIELYPDEVIETTNPWPVPHTSKIVFDFGSNITVEITKPFEISQVYRGENGTFYVCLELLESRFQSPDYTSVSLNSLSVAIQNVLTGVCVSSSLISLFATVSTYCLFPSLRGIAGCNTLGLSASLFFSQMLLLLGNNVPGPSRLCTAMGIISHYSWLVMFTWTFLCCLHMLRVFTAINLNSKSMSKRSEKRAIALNVTLSFLVPSLIVGAIVVVNVVMHHVTIIGYGSYSCWVDNVYTIHGPLIFVTSCNIFFFVIVVFKIWSVRRLQQTDEFWKDFIVYIKLSTLTGMFWLLVILGEVFQNDVIRCFAIISNGSQGVFIFFSFVANRRVLKLYVDKFNLRWVSPDPTSSSTGYPATTKSEMTQNESPAESTHFECVNAGNDLEP